VGNLLFNRNQGRLGRDCAIDKSVADGCGFAEMRKTNGLDLAIGKLSALSLNVYRKGIVSNPVLYYSATMQGLLL
jgi:hypothetical protein